MGDNDVGHPRQDVVEHRHDMLGLAELREPRVTAQIRHQNRQLALLAPEPLRLRGGEQFLRNFWRNVAAERTADEVALP